MDCIVLNNVSAAAKRFELSFFKPADDAAAGFVAHAWEAQARGETSAARAMLRDLEACLEDCYLNGVFTKREIIAFMNGTWREFLNGAPEVRRASTFVVAPGYLLLHSLTQPPFEVGGVVSPLACCAARRFGLGLAFSRAAGRSD